jgi:hypothetical protein
MWLALAVLVTSSPAFGWTIGGRFGLELDGIEEKFQSSGLFDERVGEDGTVEQILDVRPVLSRSTTTLGLLEARLESESQGPFLLRLSDLAHVGTRRGRNTLRTETAYRTPGDRVSLETEWDVQGGKDEPVAGSSLYLTSTWDRKHLPLGLRSLLRFASDWSHTDRKELAPILESRSYRGQLELRRAIGWTAEIRGLAGARHKDALASRVGSYDSWFGQIESDVGMGTQRRLELLGRIEDRTYVADTLGIPSSRGYELSGRYEHGLEVIDPYVQQELDWQDYRGPSEIFQDHRLWKSEIGVDMFENALLGRSEETTPVLRPDVRLRIGGEYTLFQSDRAETDSLSFDSTYDSYGGILGLAREGSETFWFDLDLGAGRREYRNGAGSQGLVFEGLNLSLSSSDYTYLRASLLLDWVPMTRIRAEALAQWEQELHDRSEDDFRLLIFNVSLTYRF